MGNKSKHHPSSALLTLSLHIFLTPPLLPPIYTADNKLNNKNNSNNRSNRKKRKERNRRPGSSSLIPPVHFPLIAYTRLVHPLLLIYAHIKPVICSLHLRIIPRQIEIDEETHWTTGGCPFDDVIHT